MATTRNLLALVMALSVPALAAGQTRPHASPAERVLALAYAGSQGAEQTETFSRTFNTGPRGTLDLSNLSGSITVTGGPGGEIAVTAVKRARDREGRSAKEQMDLVSIDIAERSGRVEVRTHYPRNERNFRVSVDYEVRVPAEATVLLRSVSGNVTVRDVRGEIRAESVSGSLKATGTGRNVFLKSVSGGIEATGSPADAELTLQTVSGTVVARDLKCRSVDGNTVSGDIRLLDSTCERVTVRGVSGDVEYSGSLVRSGRYEIRSHSGNIRLALAPEVGFEIDATTFSGNLTSDLPVTMISMGGSEGRGRGRMRSLRGTYGDASAILNVTTFSGNVQIVKR